MINLLIH